MDNIQFVAVIDREKNLFENFDCILFWQEFFFNNQIEELTTLTKFSDEMNILGIFKIFIHLQDIWVIQFPKYFNLIIKPLDVSNLCFVDCLAGSDLSCFLVQYSMDCAKGAAT